MLRRRSALIVLLAALAVVAAACSLDDGADTPSETLETAADTTTTTTTTADDAPDGPEGAGLVIQDGDIVEVHYVGTLDDGSQFDSSRDRGTPFTFTVGVGDVIAGFDEAVRGASVGDVNTVRMEAADAYGEPSDDNIIVVPFNPEQGDVEVGDEVFLNNGQPAVVLEVTEETVTLDANHPLAGEALTFEIEILSVTRG